MNIEVTSVSSKGQIVIPKKIRQEIGIKEGTKVVVVCDGENVLLKPIEAPGYETFKKLIKQTDAFVKKHRITKADLEKTIKNVRHENRR